MKKRSLLPLFINAICGALILILLLVMVIGGYHIGLYAILMIALGGAIITFSGVGSYFIHDRLCGFLGILGVILTMIGNRSLFINPVSDYVIVPTIILLFVQVLGIASLAGCVLAIYRLPINGQQFDNKIFGEVNTKQGLSMLVYVVNCLLLLIIIVSQILVKVALITPTVCIIALLALSFGKVLSFFYHQRIGSVIVAMIPLVIILGMNPKEVSLDNTCVIIMLLEYVAATLLALLEVAKLTPAVEAKIGPKEYKEK